MTPEPDRAPRFALLTLATASSRVHLLPVLTIRGWMVGEQQTGREAGSTDGSWRLVLAIIEPGNSATIPIVQLPDGATEPEWYSGEQTLTFVWRDGRRQVWSWANLLSADYEPPVRAKEAVARG